MRYLEEDIRSGKLREFAGDCVAKLAELGCEGLDETVFAVFENCETASLSIGEYPFFKAVTKQAAKVFSKDYIKKFEALYEKRGKGRHSYVFTWVINGLRDAYGE
jgi:hypothetical protein